MNSEDLAEMAIEVATESADCNMIRGGRKEWNLEDHQIFIDVFEQIMHSED